MFNLDDNILITFSNFSWNYYFWIQNFITLILKFLNYRILVISKLSANFLFTTSFTVLWQVNVISFIMNSYGNRTFFLNWCIWNILNWYILAWVTWIWVDCLAWIYWRPSWYFWLVPWIAL